MRTRVYLLLAVICAIVLANETFAESTPVPQCTTTTSGQLVGEKHGLLVTALSPEIRNWEIKVTKRVPLDCARINGVEVVVCDSDSPPKVKLTKFTVNIRRTGELLGEGDLDFAVYCDPLGPYKISDP